MYQRKREPRRSFCHCPPLGIAKRTITWTCLYDKSTCSSILTKALLDSSLNSTYLNSKHDACQLCENVENSTAEGEAMNKKTDVPIQHWDRLFAPSACLVMITTVDTEGRINAASYGTCVRVCHDPVYIAF